MADQSDITRAAREILEDPSMVESTAERIKAGDKTLLGLMLNYARQPADNRGRAHARRVLELAGISWEA